MNSVFVSTFNAIEGADAYLNGDAEHVSGIVVDGRSLTLNLIRVDANVLTTFSQFPVMPKHLMADVNPLEFQQHPVWQNPIGTVPFRIEEIQMNDFTRFVPFEDYHGGTAKIDEVVAWPGGESDESIARNAAAGLLDFGSTRTLYNVEALREMDHITLTPVDINYTRSFRVNAFPFKPE